MNLDTASVTSYDPGRWTVPEGLVAALPESAREAVDLAAAALDRLHAIDAPFSAPTARDVVRLTADRIERAVIAAENIDVDAVAGEVLARADAEVIAVHAVAAARTSLEDRLLSAMIDALPEALRAWDAQVRDIAVKVGALVDQGATTDELAARRGTKTDIDRWGKLTGLLAEYDAIRAAFLDARWVLKRGDARERFELSASFRGVYETRDGRAFLEAVEAHGHPLLAGISLGWEPWCPTLEQQQAGEHEAMRVQRENGPSIPRAALVG